MQKQCLISHGITIDVSHLSPGSYAVTIRQGNNSETKKMVIR
jgi:hypothetical protein